MLRPVILAAMMLPSTAPMVAWMAAVAFLVLAEKALPSGDCLARLTGSRWIAAGAVVLA
jgi:predicted metal-binding membrane protein